MNMLNILLSSATANASGQVANTPATNWTQLIFLVVLTVGLLLVMILPQRKRNKQMAEMMDSIKPGSKIRTIGGIYGTVTVVKEDLVTIVSGPDNVKLVFAKGAIAVVEPEEAEANISEEELNELEENSENK